MRKLLYGCVLVGLFCLTVPTHAHDHAKPDTTGLQVGNAAPTFQAKADSGKLWKSNDHVGKSILVVYFFPAALTGG